MTITLYVNNSEPNKVDKDLSNPINIDGALRDGSSIIDPVIDIELSSGNIANINYIHIQEWDRYYFVNNISSVVNGLWTLSCHVDVLSSYKKRIKNLSAIIARQQNEYNLYLNDDKFLVNAQREYWTKAFPNRVASSNSIAARGCILTLAGGAEQI